MAPSVWTAESRFGLRTVDGTVVEEVEPLGFDLQQDRFGSGVMPGLSGIRDALADALDRPGLEVSLGRSRARIQETRIRVPVRLDVGVTDWLTVGATVPFVKRRTEVGFAFRADTATADLGLSPSTTSPGTAELFLQSLSTAVDAMAGRVETLCGQAPDSSECSGARDALSDGRSFRDALEAAYGQRFFPFAGSSTGDDLRSRLDGLVDRFAGFGVTAVPDPGSLPLAEAPLEPGAIQRVVADPAFGVAGDSIRTWESLWEPGDVELHAAARVLERSQPDTAGFFEEPSLLVGVGGLVRLGTGVPDDPDNFVDVASGDGQVDVEVRVFGDVGFARRIGVWADVRYGIQLEGEVVRRIAPPEAVLAPLSSRAPVTWDPGDYLELEVAPRWRLTPELAAALRYRFYSQGAAEYGLGAVPDTVATPAASPDLLERESERTLHETGVSLVYSTLLTTREGRTGTPLEARLRYRRAVAGGGGLTRKASRYEAGLRLFWRLWGE